MKKEYLELIKKRGGQKMNSKQKILLIKRYADQALKNIEK